MFECEKDFDGARRCLDLVQMTRVASGEASLQTSGEASVLSETWKRNDSVSCQL